MLGLLGDKAPRGAAGEQALLRPRRVLEAQVLLPGGIWRPLLRAQSFRLQNFTNETSFEYARHVSSFLTAKLRLEWFASFAIARGVRLPASAEPSWAARLEMEVGSVATVLGSEGETLAAAAQGDGRGAFLE